MCKFKSVLYDTKLKKVYQINGINSHSTIAEKLGIDEDKLYKYEIELFNHDKIRIELDSFPYDKTNKPDDYYQADAYNGAMKLIDYYAKSKNKLELFEEAKDNIQIDYESPDYVSASYYGYFTFKVAPKETISLADFIKMDKLKAKTAKEHGLEYQKASKEKLGTVDIYHKAYASKLIQWQAERNIAENQFNIDYVIAEKEHAKKYQAYKIALDKMEKKHDREEKRLKKNLKEILNNKEWEYSEEGFFKKLVY